MDKAKLPQRTHKYINNYIWKFTGFWIVSDICRIWVMWCSSYFKYSTRRQSAQTCVGNFRMRSSPEAKASNYRPTHTERMKRTNKARASRQGRWEQLPSLIKILSVHLTQNTLTHAPGRGSWVVIKRPGCCPWAGAGVGQRRRAADSPVDTRSCFCFWVWDVHLALGTCPSDCSNDQMAQGSSGIPHDY